MVEDISRYAFIFTYTGPNFAERLPQVLTSRLTTHMALLLGVDEHADTETVNRTITLYQHMAETLVGDFTFFQQKADASIEETFYELKQELQALDKLPSSIHEMIEAEVHANQHIRSIANDSVMPHEQFAQLLNLYVTSRLMDTQEAEHFLNRLGESVGLAPQKLQRQE
jgi:hypothetical protein